MTLALKKNKYAEVLNNLIKEHMYTVGDQLNICIELLGKTLAVIAGDLGMQAILSRNAMQFDTGSIIKKFASPMQRMCIDLVGSWKIVTGTANGEIRGFANINELGIIIRKVKDGVFINGLDPTGVFREDDNLVMLDSFYIPVDSKPSKEAYSENIKSIKELIDKLVHYLKLDDNFTLSMEDYNALIREINRLNTKIANLEEELNSGTVKIKRDKKLDDAIEKGKSEIATMGFADVKECSLTISHEMLTAGWVRTEYKLVETHGKLSVRSSFMDAKVHPTVVHISINKDMVKFYLVKVVSKFDISTGRQQVEYELLHESPSMADATSYIHNAFYK